MTAPVTPSQAENELRRLSRRLEAKCDELPGLLREAALADVDYRVSFAKALLNAEAGTVSEREAHATLAVADKLTARKVTEAVASASVESIRATRDQLHAVMSVNVNARQLGGSDR
jgi:hypothetical protein